MATKAEAAKRREANRKQYAPRIKPMPAKPSGVSVADARLRKIVVRMLDELKMPGSVPSEVLMKGVSEAAGR